MIISLITLFLNGFPKKKKFEGCALDFPRMSFDKRQSGFALVIALTLMAFLVLLLSGLLVVVSIETQVAVTTQRELEAKSNALLGLQTAIGRLQQFAGPDQRITSYAGLLDDTPKDHSTISGVENPHWVGVWTGYFGRDLAFNQSFDRKNEALTWLVSGNEYSDPQEPDIDAVTDSLDPADPDTVTLLRSVSKAEDEVRVMKTPVGPNGAYAFWVADEGLKAKINPDDERLIVNSELTEQPMANRINLGSSPRPAIEFLSGMEDFGSYAPTSKTDFTSIHELTLIDLDFEQPARDFFHDVSVHSQGVLSDTARGGLKRDLSFAFELDDEKFLQTEFAGDYHLKNPGEDFSVSFLYHEPVPNDASLKVRGPTWHHLRDFYRLYKEVEAADGAPLIQARTVFPNVPEVQRLGVSSAKNHGPVETYRNKGDYLDESYSRGSTTMTLMNTTKAQVMPLLNRLIYYFYMDVGPDPNHPELGDDLRLIYNPAIVLWNPYNVSIHFESILLETRFLPIRLEYQVARREADGQIVPRAPIILRIEEAMVATALAENKGGNYEFLEFQPGDNETRNLSTTGYINFVINSDGTMNPSQSVSMQPGELKVFSINDPDIVGFQEEVYATEGWSVDGGAAVTRIKPFEQDHDSDGKLEVRYDPVSFDENASIMYVSMAPANAGMTLSLTDVKMTSDPHRIPSESQMDAHDLRSQFPEAWGGNLKFVNSDPVVTGELNNRGPFSYPELKAEKQTLAAVDIFLKTATEEQYPNELFGFGNFRSLRSHFRNAFTDQEDSYRWGFWGIRYWDISSPNDSFFQFDGGTNQAYWGESIASSSGSNHVISFEVPTYPMVSLGSLQHLDISPSAYNPAYGIGNSLASPFFKTDEWIRMGVGNNRTTWDVSLFANRNLWDRYFFSSIAPEVNYSSNAYQETRNLSEVVELLTNGDAAALRNGRMQLREDSQSTLDEDIFDEVSIDPNGYRAIAGHLMLDGAFNVNSTSVEAWKSLLMSTAGATVSVHEPGHNVTEQSSGSDEAVVSRFSLPAGHNGAEWTGYHSITATEAEVLAREIVTEVKKRGPFLSLADFVNRRLADDETGLKGVLQAAIDNATINSGVDYDPIYTGVMPYPENVGGHTGRGIAGYTMQGDLLTPIASQLSVRSDTFVVRAYGEVRDPLTDAITGEAWCEAVVQRFPDFIDDSNPAHTPMDDAEATFLGMNKLSDVNVDFGREFRIVSFRWLDRNEV